MTDAGLYLSRNTRFDGGSVGGCSASRRVIASMMTPTFGMRLNVRWEQCVTASSPIGHPSGGSRGAVARGAGADTSRGDEHIHHGRRLHAQSFDLKLLDRIGRCSGGGGPTAIPEDRAHRADAGRARQAER
jgi:hypothetical protein